MLVVGGVGTVGEASDRFRILFRKVWAKAVLLVIRNRYFNVQYARSGELEWISFGLLSALEPSFSALSP